MSRSRDRRCNQEKRARDEESNTEMKENERDVKKRK